MEFEHARRLGFGFYVGGMIETVPLDRAALIVNTGSRAGAKAYEPARAALLDRGARLIRSEAVDDPKQIPDVVRLAVGDGCRLIVIGGGDGTIGCAAGVLARIESERCPVLGVLPLGTANDFARTLDIPNQIDGAADVLADGKIVDVDLGWGNDQPFVNVASLGLSVGSAKALRPGLKKALGPLSYPVSAAVAYARHQPFGLRIEFPEHDFEPLELDDLLQVFVGNGRYYGGGHAIAPDAGIDDHKLDVYAVKAGRLRDHVSLAGLLKDGTIIDHEDVQHLVTRSLRLMTDSEQAVNLDGEIATHSPVHFRIQRNAVEVVVPQHVTHVRHDSAQRRGRAVNSSTSDS